MLTNLYVLIIIITIVQIILSKNLMNKPNQHETALQLLDIMKSKGDFDPKKMRSLLQNEAKYFDGIVESATVITTTSKKPIVMLKKRNPKNNDKSYHEIKMLLSKLLDQVMEIEKDKREEKATTTRKVQHSASTVPNTRTTLSNKISVKKKKEDCAMKARWGHWTDWSSCSVSCGKGRQIRWRHCIGHCDDAETEMEEKTCQLPACGPGKLFGVIQLR